VITTFDYDVVGNRTWQQVGPDSTRRVWFYYYPGLPSGVGLLRATKAPLVARDSLLYSAYGNVYRTRSPQGYWETRVHEASGHDTSAVVAIAAGDTSSTTSTTGRLVTRITHDIMGRVTATDVTGPPTSYATASRSGTIPQQTLYVRNFYNQSGLTDSVQRWASPDTNHIGVSTTRWTRDNADRTVTETTPDGVSTSDTYDQAGNVTTHQGRRTTVVSSTYDLLNRVTRRQSPNIFYADTTIPVYRFPRYRLGSGGYMIPGDTATFTYDNVGNMLTANNGAAHISRSYNANGSLATDTMRMRTWEGSPGDFNQHIYGNTYTYDLAGRRISLTLPAVVGGTQQFSYDAITGNLGSVTDLLGNRFAYSYDAAGRMDSLEYPGKIFEKSSFNAGGELWRRREVAYNTFIGTDSGFATNGVIHDDTLFYDARGKIVKANVILQRIVNSYSGLGAMTSSYMRDSTAPAGIHITEEAYEQDALGNNYFSFDRFPGTLLSVPDPEYKKFFYQPATGRQVKTMAGTQASQIIAMADTSLYDRSGNTGYYARVTPVLSASATSTFQRSYYDGLDKLAVAEKYSSDSTSKDGGFEEYRYDALGRRVLRRWRGYWACANPCYNSIDRTVWDGNQILIELRQDGSDLLSPAELETDRGGPAGLSRRYYGAVAYTHAGGIDQPVDLIRYDYDTPWNSPIAIIPHDNWRGEPDLGSYANGTSKSLKTLPNGTQDSLRVDWPSKSALATHRLLGTFGYRGWFGGLVTQQRDGSGQMYMRNRYYDPATGRFTQEDPIGLAGGLNAYGFASGDPISYSDPFGLAACKYYEVECLSDELSAWGGGTGVAGRVLVPSVLTAVSFFGLDAAESDAAGAANGSKLAAGSLAASFILAAVPGGSGARKAETLAEQMAMDAAKSGLGREIMEGKIKDVTKAGMAKMEVVATNKKGKALAVVHYWMDRATGELSGFKFKDK
jgi:RHS repeat-associated protein